MEPPRFLVLCDPGVAAALLKACDATPIGLDVGEDIEPKLPFRLAPLEAEDLFRLIANDGETTKRRGRQF